MAKKTKTFTIISQQLHPELGNPSPTIWKSLEDIVSFGSECDRQVLDKSDDMVLVLVPSYDSGSLVNEIYRYHLIDFAS